MSRRNSTSSTPCSRIIFCTIVQTPSDYDGEGCTGNEDDNSRFGHGVDYIGLGDGEDDY